MTARKNDYESKKFILDIWSATWDDTTKNKLRYFDDCIPANGPRSMRNPTVWGTDTSRKKFLIKARKEAKATTPSWRHDFIKRHLAWKQYSICMAEKLLKDLYKIKAETAVDISDVEGELKKKLACDSKIADRLLQKLNIHKKTQERKLERRIARLDRRIQTKKNNVTLTNKLLKRMNRVS